MRTRLFFLLIITKLALANTASCQLRAKPVVSPDSIMKNINNFLEYNGDHLIFDGDFVAYDVQGRKMVNDEFFKMFATGDYLPLQLYSKNNAWEYQLYKLKSGVDRDAQIMLKQTGLTDYGIYQTKGKPFPNFHYVDLNGKVYTSANTKGKIVVLKAWFTSCIPCVAEMPELNKLVDKYKNRKDIIFVSIAFDSKEKLQKFAKRTLFKYSIVPVSADYIQDTLHATGYPAHWVINKQGVVVSMSYNSDEMIAALSKEAAK
jgi:peroxiredoxin